MKKDLKYYMNLPYELIITSKEGKYFARYKDFPLSLSAKTEKKAIKRLKNAFAKRLKIMLKNNDFIKEPSKKETILKNLNELFVSRAKFYAFFDENIAKIKGDIFDFENAEALNVKKVYERFYHFDYAIRKLLPSVYSAYEIKDSDLSKDF